MTAYFKSRQPVIYLLAFCTLVCLLQVFFPQVPGLTPAYGYLSSWMSILIGFVYIPSTISLIVRSAKSVQKRTERWYVDAIILAMMVITAGVYLSGGQSMSSTQYRWIFNILYTACQSAVWGIMALWLVYIPTQSFLFKNVDMALFTIVAVITALGVHAPVGTAIWGGFPIIGQWIVNYPDKGVSYATGVLTGVGVLLTGLRMIRGQEKGVIA